MTTHILLSSLFLALPCIAAADDATTLERVEVVGHYSLGLGESNAASEGSVRATRIEARPTLRPAELLEFVPGMIVTQHSGDGKANQYFLRGFNLDHGTNFASYVDGVPVNMVSNAHGQGYTDLNFLIPELVNRIDYRKGRNVRKARRPGAANERAAACCGPHRPRPASRGR